MSRAVVTRLSELRADDGGHLVVVCWCGRQTEYDIADVRAYFHAKGWSDRFGELPRRFRCAPKSPWGCGRRAKRVIFAFGPPALPLGSMPEVKP